MLTMIDYATGKPGTGEAGKILKLLQKDRRIDPGMKYSPVFGRYSFVDRASEGVTVRVGDEVKVVKRNDKGTLFGEPTFAASADLANVMQTGLVWPPIDADTTFPMHDNPNAHQT